MLHWAPSECSVSSACCDADLSRSLVMTLHLQDGFASGNRETQPCRAGIWGQEEARTHTHLPFYQLGLVCFKSTASDAGRGPPPGTPTGDG